MAKVDTKHTEYTAQAVLWKRCRDFVAGSDAVKDAGEEYLAKLGGQETTLYDAYKERAQFYNATGRTVDGMTGLVMRIDPAYELPPQLEDLANDVDYAGTTLLEFATLLISEGLTVGREGILVDMPTRPEDIVTVAQAQAVNLRPYLAHYPAESILNWRTERRGCTTVTTLVVLKETVQEVGEDGDPFVLVNKDQYRVLDLDEAGYRQRVFENIDGEFMQLGDDILPMLGTARMARIPFYFIGSDSNSTSVQKPPVADLVSVNLGHYRNSADYEHGLHFTGLPTPVITGHSPDTDEVIAIGSEVFLTLPGANAKAYFLEFSGSGLGALENAMRAKKQEMATLGARLLAEESKGVEAAETARIHRSGESGILSRLGNAAGKGLLKALRMAAEWVNANPEAATFTYNQDFLPTSMDAGLLRELMASWQSGAISHAVLFDNLKRGEIVRGETTLEEMKEDIDSDLPGSAAGNDQAGAPAAE